jgi:hypothetical protein
MDSLLRPYFQNLPSAERQAILRGLALPPGFESYVYQEGTFTVNGGSITLNAKKNIVSGDGCGKTTPPKDWGAKTETQQWSVGPDPALPSRIMLKVGVVSYFK